MIRITPKGKQKDVMALPTEGHFIVLGTAGSGKTNIAILRSIHLANLNSKNKVLLVTFNKALVKYMRELSGDTPSNLIVENYHRFATGYMHYREKLPGSNGIIKAKEKAELISQAVNLCSLYHPNESTFKRPIEFFIDEINFIEKFGFRSFEEYHKTERIGRSSANIKRENRKWTFEAYERYLELRKESGYLYDFEDLALYVDNELQSDPDPRRYTHIVVDEGQDFSPMMIRSLVKAVGDGGSFTFFGDVAQQIYGSRLSWRDSGIASEKIWRFDINYRNPETITNFANELTLSRYWQKNDDIILSVESYAKGPKPLLVAFSERKKETDWFIKRAIAESGKSSVGIILRRRSQIDEIYNKISQSGGSVAIISGDFCDGLQNKVVYLTTFHAAKGLEFENVFIPYLSDDEFPDGEAFDEALSEDEAYSNELKLLYVGVTRSKFGLFMTYTDKPSALLPTERASCTFIDHREARNDAV